MKNFIMHLCLAGWFALPALAKEPPPKEPVDYVNTRIGNISILLMPTYPTAHLPNSMLRMIPSHADFVSDRIQGFPLNVPMHRQGDVLYLMPYCGDTGSFSDDMTYRYDQEVATPYRYSALLDDYGIVADFAPAARAAVYAFTFEQDDAPRCVALRTAGSGEMAAGGKVISGYENYRGVKHYFYLEFEQAPLKVDSRSAGTQEQRAACRAAFDRSVKTVCLRYGISYISVEQARRNMEAEVAGSSLDDVAQKARGIWNSTLGKVEVEGGSDDQKATFYTALYRAHERMVNISEDGKYYSAFDQRVHDDEGVPFYTDDWIWDTHLALHPLQSILAPQEQAQKLASYIRMCEQSSEGWMPTFPCVHGDVHCMNGNHAAAIFADALCKNIPFDVEKAFEGMKRTVLTETMIPWRRAPKTELDDFYHEHGWFPALHPDEAEPVSLVSSVELRQAVSVTQAAAYDNWCIARLAKALGRREDYDFFISRAASYRHLFNSETGFFHPKDKDGKFIEPFDYKVSGGYGSRAYYDENNAWTYIWDVRHNVDDLISLFGGREPFVQKLDRLFVEDLGRAKWQYAAMAPDATGNIGQYVAGNEPSFHIPYLYCYAGQPWKTQKRIRMVLESWFRNDLMGMPGDEDGGAMSAYYVFSAMGFYPVSVGTDAYTIGSPIFSKVTVHLPDGKVFTLKANGASWSNKYIRSAKLNGQPLNAPWFSHRDILAGGTLELEMSNRPNREWGRGE
ncbi:MAG: GH92 family glycosyl hydrolase [Prevotellaceae bacterium]|nr:GH92 family glycosyl hydrolase [Prevotellaceae bacterium]